MSEEYLDMTGVNLDDTFEPVVLEKGAEARLRITGCKSGKNETTGIKYLMVFFDNQDEPYFKEFGEYLPFPHESMSPKENNNAKLKLNAFKACFDIDLSGTVDVKNDIVGKEGDVILGVGKDKDGAPCNKVDKYL
mgnify:CR=1 FL=1